MKNFQFCDVISSSRSPAERLVTYPPFLIGVAVLLLAVIVTVVLVVRAKKKKAKAAAAQVSGEAEVKATEANKSESAE